ncbi:hypothetical protein [Phenylobacterium sp.]|uniref:hypothetical protein n=1 Tax=Phenylobacterium sp. TaxID=1871053 RepID=UPI003BA8C9D6
MLSLNPQPWTIRPAKAGQVIMACIGTPFIVLSVVGGWALAKDGDIPMALFAGGFLFLLGGWCVLEIATVRLHLSADRLWLTRYWHTRWSIPRASAELQAGGVGDVPILPGIRVFDRRTGKKVGEIISGQFPADDLARLRAELTERA